MEVQTGPTIQVGLVGCGRWGQHILRDLKLLGCQVRVVEHSAEGAERAIAGGAERVVRTIHELDAVDGVIVATPSSTHAAIIDKLLPRGVPLFVEKPLTTDLESAQRLADVAGDRVFVMHKWRYHPGIEALGAIAQNGELGPVRGMRLIQTGWGNPHRDADSAWILLPHCLSIAYGVLGELPAPRAVVLDAAASDRITGMVALLGTDPWVAIDISSRSPSKQRTFQLICRDGVAELSGQDDTIVTVTRGRDPDGCQRTDKAQSEQRRVGRTMPLLAEVEEFVNHLRGGPPPRCSAAEGAMVVERIDQLRHLGHDLRFKRAG